MHPELKDRGGQIGLQASADLFNQMPCPERLAMASVPSRLLYTICLIALLQKWCDFPWGEEGCTHPYNFWVGDRLLGRLLGGLDHSQRVGAARGSHVSGSPGNQLI